jgi:hypothetical protein
MRCVALGWLIHEAFVFVKVCKLLQIHTHEMTTRWCDVLLSVGWLMMLFFICKSLQALYLYTRMRWQHGDAMRCYRLVAWWCFCICKRFASSLPLHTHERWQHCDAMRCVSIGWLLDEAFVFVKVCELFTSTHAWDENTAMRCVAIGWSIQSTESPIFDAHFWSENGG